MMPSCSKRTAPVNWSRPSPTSRSMRSIEPMDPSKLIPPTLSAASGSARQIISRVQFVVERLSYFSTEHIDQVLFRRLLHAGDAPEPFDEKATTFVSNARKIFQLAVQRPLRSSPAMR